MSKQAIHPVSGVIPISEFQSLSALPHGEASKAIRKYDPAWPAEQGDTQTYKVALRGEIEVETVVTVKAASKADAAQKATEMAEECEVDWDYSLVDLDPLCDCDIMGEDD